jgi:transposase
MNRKDGGMASLVYLKNKKNNTIYVYENTSFWNRETKRPDSKRRCIGKLDPDTKEIIPNTRGTDSPSVATIGNSVIFNKVAGDLGIRAILESVFPDDWPEIMTAAYSLVGEGKALCRCESWSTIHENPLGGILKSQRIGDLLPKLTRERQLRFFKEWAALRRDNEYFALDITSVSSYSESNEFVRRGYNRDKEKLPQINLCMVLGEKSRIPVYYDVLPGSIKDVSSLKNIVDSVRFLGTDRVHLVMDKGFYSESNIDALYDARFRFAIGVPFTTKFATARVESVREEITDFKNFSCVGGQDLFMTTRFEKWKGHRCYVHMYYDGKKAADGYAEFLKKVQQWKAELENEPLKEHKEQYAKYFEVTETPKRGRKVTPRDDVIKAYGNNTCGWFVMQSNDIRDPVEALRVYRDKDAVEKGFDDMKNALDMKRLRVHSPAAMEGRLFVQFVSLILVAGIRNVMEKSGLCRNMTMPEMIGEMQTLRKVVVPGKRKALYTERTKRQKEILDAFGIKTYV